MKIIKLPEQWQGESEYFLEGAILASNMAVKPLAPAKWCESVGVTIDESASLLVPHIHLQYNMLQRSDYSLSALSQRQLADLSEGFMTVWPTVKSQYQEVELGDGTLRMLQALLTTFMLAIDEDQTQAQMKASGISEPPQLSDYVPQLDLMVMEAFHGADELMTGAKGQSVNPYKSIGRNEPCSCNSGKKFKQCCGK